MALWTPEAIGARLAMRLAGSAVAEADGVQIAQWSDTTSYGRNAVGQGATKPVAVAAGLNGYKTVRFQGAGFFALPSTLLTGRTSSTTFFVAKTDAIPSSEANAGPVIGDFGPFFAGNHYPYTNGIVYDDYCSTSRQNINPGVSLTQWRVAAFRAHQDGRWQFWLDGSLIYQVTNNPYGVNTAPLIGKATQNSSVFLYVGQVADIVDYSDYLTTDEFDRTFGALAHRYGLQGNLPANHAYKTSAPTNGADGAKADASPVLASIGASGAGSLRIIGAAVPAIGDVSAAGGASVEIAANARVVLDVAVALGAGAAPVSGIAVAELAAVTIAGSATLPISAASEQRLAPANAAGIVGLGVAASSSPVLRSVTAATAAAVTIAGLSVGALGPIGITASAGAQQLSAAFATIDLVAIKAAGASSIDVRGSLAATVPAAMAVGDARAPAAGNAGVLIGQVAGRSAARTGTAGLSDVRIGPLASAGQARTTVTAAIETMLRPVTACGAAVTGSGSVGPIDIPARNRFVIPARQRRFTVPRRQRSFLIRKGTCMSSITKYAAEDRQYQADWSADLNGQTIAGDIVPSSNDPTLIVDRVTYDGPVMKFWLQGGTSGKVAAIRFVVTTSGGENLAWQQAVVVY